VRVSTCSPVNWVVQVLTFPSRGAYTARAVAGMVTTLGLLTRAGMEYYYPIFKDMQNWRTPDYDDPFPGVPFVDKPRGPKAAPIYQKLLEERGFTRLHEDRGSGALIKVKAVGMSYFFSAPIPRLC